MEEGELLKICGNCNYYFPSPDYDEWGVCTVNIDEKYESFIDDICQQKFEVCPELVEKYKRNYNDECPSFIELESSEMSDEQSERFKNAIESGDKEKIEQTLFEIQLENIDYKNLSVEEYRKDLFSNNKKNVENLINKLEWFACNGNEEALKLLAEYYNFLPPVITLDEAKNKINLLNKICRFKTPEIAKCLFNELNKTKSTPQSRTLYNEIFKNLEHMPLEYIEQDLYKMLNSKNYTYKIKNKFKEILEYAEYLKNYKK